MKLLRVFTLTMILAALLSAGRGWAQADDFGSFYGSQNIQHVTARYAPVMSPEEGSAYEMMFGFNTLSKRSENVSTWRMFYGVGMGGGGFTLADADFGKYEERDAESAYGMIQLEGKVFANTDQDIRPYFGGYIGLGRGGLWLERDKTLPDPPVGVMTEYYAGIEAGMHIILDSDYALVLAAGMDAKSLQYDSETSAYYPAMISIGISKWLGPMQ